MTKCVPPESLGDSRSERCRTNDFLEDNIWPEGMFPARVRAGEYPIVCFRISTGFFPEPEIGGHLGINWDRFARCFCFTVAIARR